VPRVIADEIERQESDPSNRQVRANKYRLLAASAEKFTPKWAAFEARREQVADAVARAAKLRADHQLAEARACLEAVITPVVRDASGAIQLQRTPVEPIDAELPAVRQLAELAREQGDMHRVVEVAADLYVRRELQPSRDHELAIWLALDTQVVEFLQAQAGPFTPDQLPEIVRLYRDASAARSAGATSATTYRNRLGEVGIRAVGFASTEKIAPGSWVLMDVPMHKRGTKLEGNAVAYDDVTEWEQPYDCVETSRIESIDPRTGKIHYRQQCKSKTMRHVVTLRASLGRPVPEWSSDAPWTVLGRVKASGPSWVIDDLSLPDLRFYSGAASRAQ
jgi:hypothetical protein